MAERVVVALGGNAILQQGQAGTFAEQYANLQLAAEQLAEIAASGHELAIVHGNGPQIGNLLLQNELAAGTVPPLPLPALGAQTQGWLGYAISQALAAALAARGATRPVAAVVTQVVVDARDPAFGQPSKPVGPFYTEQEALARRAAGQPLREDAGRGWRRVVPSPEPLAIVELPVIQALLAQGVVVIACGGGGVPVVRSQDGSLQGIDAVIDKDLAASCLAQAIGADTLAILTDVAGVAIDWGSPGERLLGQMHLAEVRRYQDEGHFSSGSMGPKVEAAARFVRTGGRRAIIGSLRQAAAVLGGRAGTIIVA